MSDPESLMHPQMKAVVAKLLELGAGRPPKADWTVEEARRYMREDQAFWGADKPDVELVRDDVIHGPYRPIPARLFRPVAHDALPVVIYFHGGGWAKGDLDTHDKVGRLIALASGAAVVSVDYALAPEQPFPKPYEECVAAVEAVAADWKHWGIDPERIVLAGDSAGANLALAAMLALRKRDPGMIKAGLLFYGVFDCDLGTESYQVYGGGDFPPLSRDDMAAFWKHYVPDESARSDPRAAPARADLAGLPPLFLCAAGLDCLRDDTLNLTMALKDAGVPHELAVYEGVGHGFLQFARLLDAGHDAIKAAGAFAKTVF